jgi:hypothetical protein
MTDVDRLDVIEQCETLTRLIRHGVEALRDGDGDAITARATLANIEQLDKRVHQLAGAVEENEKLRGATSALFQYVARDEHDPERARALVSRALDALGGQR